MYYMKSFLIIFADLYKPNHLSQTPCMAVGTGGAIAPPIFWQPKKFKIIKTTTYRSVYRYMAKIC